MRKLFTGALVGILAIAALAFVPLSAVAQSPAQPGVKAGGQAEGEPTTRSNSEQQFLTDAFNREHDRANANEREMNRWHNKEIQAEEQRIFEEVTFADLVRQAQQSMSGLSYQI